MNTLTSEPDHEAIEKLFTYLFGSPPPVEVKHVVTLKLGESGECQESLRRISDSTSSSDDVDRDMDIKRMVMSAIYEAMQEKHLEAVDARLQLEMKEKEVRQERYKFFVGAAGTCTALLGLVGTIVAYTASGC